MTKINSLCFLVLSGMFAFTVQAADNGAVTKICHHGDDMVQSSLLSKLDVGSWFNRGDRDQVCDLNLIENIGPIYPERAYTPGIEGWAKVSFTVTELGFVINARIIDSKPQGIFDQSAIRAAELLRFEPPLRNGMAVAVDNVQHVFDYEM